MALTLRALVLGARRAARAGRRRARQHQHHKHKYEFHGHFSLLRFFARWSARRRSNKKRALAILVDQNASSVLSPN